jgi:hypothetical protein
MVLYLRNDHCLFSENVENLKEYYMCKMHGYWLLKLVVYILTTVKKYRVD